MASIIAFDAREVMKITTAHSADEIGAAFSLILASAAGVTIRRPHVLLGMTASRWERMRWDVLVLVDSIMEQSEVRVRMGRRPLSSLQRQEILDRDGPACRWCSTTEGPWHIDHILAVIRGGTDDPDNLCVSCVPCNLSKGAKLVEDWLG